MQTGLNNSRGQASPTQDVSSKTAKSQSAEATMPYNENLVSWSKNGIILYAKGSAVALTFFESINGTNWRLHPEKYYNLGTYENNKLNNSHAFKDSEQKRSQNQSPVSNPPKTSKLNFNISRIEFSNWGSLSGDLVAVADEIGTLSILMVGVDAGGVSTLDHMAMLFQDSMIKNSSIKDTQNHSAIKNLELLDGPEKVQSNHFTNLYSTAILDLQWVCSTKQFMTSRLNAGWKNPNPGSGPAVSKLSFNSLPSFGVYHPQFIKYSCACIRRNGEFSLWYQFSNSKETKKQTLRVAENEWLDNAELAHCKENNVFYLTTYSNLDNLVSVYRISINWNSQQQQQQKQQDPQQQQQQSLEDPTLNCEKIFEMTPSRMHGDEIINLVKCSLLSRSYDANSDADLLLIYEIAGKRTSIVKRYSIQKTAPTALFTNILLKDSTHLVNTASFYQPKFVEDISIDDIVESVQYQYIQNVVHFRLASGKSKMFRKGSWKEFVYNEQIVSDQVSPLEAGFSFPVLPTNLEWCTLSPLACGLLYKIQGDPLLHYTPYLSDKLTITENKIISLAYNFVSCTHKSCMGEDATIAIQTYLMALNNTEKREQIIMAIVQTCFNFFGFLPNSAKEVVERIIITKPMQKLMLLQLELSGVFENSSRVYLMSRSIMCFRDILFAFNTVVRNAQMMIQHSATMSAQNNGGKLYQFSFSKQDLFFSLLPISKWFVKYVTFLMQQLLFVMNNSSDENNLFALSVISGKVTRVLLLAILQEINKIKKLVTKFPETAYPALNDSSIFLLKVFEDSPVSFEKFETFLVDINNKIKKNDDALLEAPANSTTAHELSSREAYILMKGTIPRKFSYFKDIVLSETFNKVIPEIDAANLFFTDTSNLKLFADEFYNKKYFQLLQPINEGLIVENEKIRMESSASFSNMDFDDVTKEPLYFNNNPADGNQNAAKDKYKRCVRCGNITMAGYVIPKSKTVVATSISTRRWCSVYSKTCTCSGMLHEI